MSAINLAELLQTLQASLESAEAALPDESKIAPPANGISLFDTKNELFLSYLHNLVFLILFKVRQVKNGITSHQENPEKELWDKAVEKMVELRLYLEQGVKPIENRLRYEIDRVIQAAADEDSKLRETETNVSKKKSRKKQPKKVDEDEEIEGSASSASGGDEIEGSASSASGGDESEDLEKSGSETSASASGEEEEKDEGEDESNSHPNRATAAANLASFRVPNHAGPVRNKASARNEGTSSGVYRPPRVMPTSMPTTDSTNKQQQRGSRSRGAVRSAAMEDYIAEELDGAPAAQPSVGSNIERRGRATQTGAQRHAADERRVYEESNFVRLPAAGKKKEQQGRADGQQQQGMRNGFGGEDWRDLGAGAEKVLRDLEHGRKARTPLDRSRKRTRPDALDDMGAGPAGASRFERKRRAMQKRSKR